MTLDGKLEGRVVVNWMSCDWQPFPGCDGLTWHPIRVASRPDDGFYLLRISAGERAPQFDAEVSEEFIVLEGSLVDSDGATLVAGDFVSYRPGADHDARSPDGCILLVFTSRIPGKAKAPAIPGGDRTVANWKTAAFDPYPGLPDTGTPLLWHNIRGNPDTAEGFYIVEFPPGAISAAHEHTGYEEFIILDGSLADNDGTTYRTNDCVSLPPGSMHSSLSVTGCVTAAMISGPFRTLTDDI